MCPGETVLDAIGSLHSVRISRLPPADQLRGTDLFVVVQSSGNPAEPLETRRGTAEQIIAAVGASIRGVVSVAGKDGVVTLTTTDIGGLDAALSTLTLSKAPAVHRHVPPDIDGLAEYVAAAVGAATNSPVLSVAGKTGDVTLTTADVGGLDPALAARSLVGHGHGAPEITGLDSIVIDGGHY